MTILFEIKNDFSIKFFGELHFQYHPIITKDQRLKFQAATNFLTFEHPFLRFSTKTAPKVFTRESFICIHDLFSSIEFVKVYCARVANTTGD